MQPSCSPTEAATCAVLPPPCCLQPPRRRCSADASPAPAKTDVIHIIRARRVVLIRGGAPGGWRGGGSNENLRNVLAQGIQALALLELAPYSLSSEKFLKSESPSW